MDEIITAIKHSNKVLLGSVFFLTFLNIYLQYQKWKLVCNSLLKIYDNSQILFSLFYGFSAGIVTPIRVGEYVGRKLPFKDVSLLKVTVATVIEKFASLIIVLIVGCLISIIFLSSYYSFIYSVPIILFFVGIITFLILVQRGYNFSSKIFNKLSKRYEFINKLKLELNYAKRMGKKSVKKLFTISLVFYLVVIMQYALLAKAFNQEGSIIIFLAAGALVMFVKSILSFLSFADLGIRESTSVFLLEKMGYTKVVGFNSAIFLFLFNLVLPSIIGLLFLLRKEK